MKKNKLSINYILNIIKTLLNICFPLITFPYVSRIIGTDNYGKINFSNSIISYFVLISALGISSYAIREGSGIRNNKEKFNKFASEIFTINMITTFISYLLLFIVMLFWSKLYDYRIILIIHSFSIIFTTIGLDWVYSIYEDYLYITVRSILVQIISLILLFVFVKSPNDYLFYAIISVLANGGANIFNFVHAKKYCEIKLITKINLKKHIIPMLLLFFSNLAISVYANSDILILGIFKDDYTVGIYSLAVKIYCIVKQLINAFIIVSIPRLSFYHENDFEKEKELFNNIKFVLILLLIPMTLGCLLLSKEIILIISGKEYIQAYKSLCVLVFAFIPSTLATLYGNGILLVNKEEKKILVTTIIGGITNILLNLILIPYFGEVVAAFTTVIAEAIVFIMNLKFSKKYVKNDNINCHIIMKILFFNIGVIFICLLYKLIFNNIYYIVLLSIFTSLIFFIIMFIKDDTVKQIITILRR